MDTSIFKKSALTKEKDTLTQQKLVQFISDRYPWLTYLSSRKNYAVRRYEFLIDEQMGGADFATPKLMKELEWKLDIIMDAEHCSVNNSGKKMIIRVPRRDREELYIKNGLDEMINSGKAPLRCYIGECDDGLPAIVDFTKVPHVMIGGTTGSGKTTCINDIILSMMYTYSSDEVQFFIIDTKKELSIYADCPHVLDSAFKKKDIPRVLKEIMNEYEERLDILNGTNIEEYNRYKRKNKLPHIIAILDEADQVLGSSEKHLASESHKVIKEIAAESRSLGMHLILASQKPVKANIDTLIKSNIPGRIALKMESIPDSRAVLQSNDAAILKGEGDGLLQVNGEISRIQCANVSHREVMKATKLLCAG